jgi:hypothetical protein
VLPRGSWVSQPTEYYPPSLWAAFGKYASCSTNSCALKLLAARGLTGSFCYGEPTDPYLCLSTPNRLGAYKYIILNEKGTKMTVGAFQAVVTALLAFALIKEGLKFLGLMFFFFSTYFHKPEVGGSKIACSACRKFFTKWLAL